MSNQGRPAGAAEAPGRRARKLLQSRSAMAEAAADLVLDLGLDQVSVEDISDRADVSRRTFSRYFTGKEDAVVDVFRADHARINAALAARPRAENPLTAYHRALRDWLADRESAWDGGGRAGRLLRLLPHEPALMTAYHRVRYEAEAESVRIVAERLRLDPQRDLRPALAVSLGAGAFGTAVRFWISLDSDGGPDSHHTLARLVDAAFAALAAEPAPERPIR